MTVFISWHKGVDDSIFGEEGELFVAIFDKLVGKERMAAGSAACTFS